MNKASEQFFRCRADNLSKFSQAVVHSIPCLAHNRLFTREEPDPQTKRVLLLQQMASTSMWVSWLS